MRPDGPGLGVAGGRGSPRLTPRPCLDPPCRSQAPESSGLPGATGRGRCPRVPWAWAGRSPAACVVVDGAAERVPQREQGGPSWAGGSRPLHRSWAQGRGGRPRAHSRGGSVQAWGRWGGPPAQRWWSRAGASTPSDWTLLIAGLTQPCAGPTVMWSLKPGPAVGPLSRQQPRPPCRRHCLCAGEGCVRPNRRQIKQMSVPGVPGLPPRVHAAPAALGQAPRDTRPTAPGASCRDHQGPPL